jgi:aminobenzoyl-glutamate transport protein
MSHGSVSKAPRGILARALSLIERVGNTLPDPAVLFLILAMIVAVASGIAAWVGMEGTHPGTGQTLHPQSLLSVPGLHYILTSMVTNFTGFAPLGTVLVSLLGIGIAEQSGLIGVCMRGLVLAAPPRLLTLVIVFAGILSNTASEVGYVLLIPLAAIIFQTAGRNPLAGLAAGFAGVSGGYSANLLLGTIDPLLAGLSQEAARIIDPAYRVNPACNYFFMVVSTFLITVVGTWVTERVVEPRLGAWKGSDAGTDTAEHARATRRLDAAEKRGLIWALGAALLFAAFLLGGTIPANGYLRDPGTGDLLHSPFMSGIVAFIFLGGGLCGLAFGIGAGTIRNDRDAIKGMSKAMSTMGHYLVLVFFAAQFVAYFNWTNLGLLFAVKGADALRSSGLGGIPLMLGFVFLAALMNLLVGSASAKWAVMAPVFIPMFMLLNYPPELVQAAYRVGDSCTNIISPMMSYFALIIAFFQKYDPRAGIGTLVATMLPYTIAFLMAWSVLLVVWMYAGWPLGF